jgi:hypothetical protein
MLRSSSAEKVNRGTGKGGNEKKHTRVVGLVGVFFAFFELGGEVLSFLFFGLVALVAGAFGADEADAGHFGWMDRWYWVEFGR